MKHLVYVACAAALLLAGCGGGNSNNYTVPPQQQAATWYVTAGATADSQAVQALQYYPSSITIDAGDSITWVYPAGEPHTVTFLGPKTSPPPPNDPSVPAPAGGKSYDGSTYTSSGFILGGGSYTLTFPKAGTYTYYCLIHGEMVGTVVVQDKGKPYPQSAGDIAKVQGPLIASDIAAGENAVTKFPYTSGGTHLAAGISQNLGAMPFTNSSVVRFLDGDQLSDTSVTIAAGTTLTWTNLDTNLPHTVTFGPAGQPFPGMPPFSPPSGGTTYDGTTLVNSGPLFGGQSFSLKFTTPGTYTYHCLFHDETENMIGTVVVQ